jgi:N-acetylglutamate synthase
MPDEVEHGAPGGGPGLRYRYVVRITPADVGQRVVLRWRRPAPGGGEEVADLLGQLESVEPSGFVVRTRSGELVTVPRSSALAGKVVPPRAW